MNKKYRHRSFFSGRAVLLCCVLVAVTMAQGCEPLRKKFTRAKRKDRGTPEVIPVLEPIEYPNKSTSPQNLYKHFYGLCEVWFKELIVEMREKDNKKRKLYIMDQLLANLEEIKNLLQKNQQDMVIRIQNGLQGIRRDIAAPVSTRSLSSLQIKLMSLEKKMRKDCRLSEVKDQLSL